MVGCSKPFWQGISPSKAFMTVLEDAEKAEGSESLPYERNWTLI